MSLWLIAQYVLFTLIFWIVIYPLGSVIQPLYNRTQDIEEVSHTLPMRLLCFPCNDVYFFFLAVCFSPGMKQKRVCSFCFWRRLWYGLFKTEFLFVCFFCCLELLCFSCRFKDKVNIAL